MEQASVINVKDMISFGWSQFERRPWFFIGALIIFMILSGIVGAIISAIFGDTGSSGAIGQLVGFMVNALFAMGLMHVYLKAHDDVHSVELKDLWHPTPYLKFLAADFLQAVIIMIGFVLLVIPGVVAMVVLAFTLYLVLDKNMGPIEAMKESVRITGGERWNLLLLLVSLIFINIIGVLCLVVGLLVTVPVSLFAIVHAYKQLQHKHSLAPAY